MSKRKNGLARRPESAELQQAAAQWGEAATRMLLDLEARLTTLEEKYANLADAYRTQAHARVGLPRRRRRRRPLAVRVLVHQQSRGTP